VFYRIFGRKFVVLNTFKAANDLLEARSNIYSDRPMAWMYNELVNRKMGVFFISSQHPRFKVYRRLLHSGLNPRAVGDYDEILDDERRILLRNLKSKPDRLHGTSPAVCPTTWRETNDVEDAFFTVRQVASS
jgi:cytochrome P450